MNGLNWDIVSNVDLSDSIRKCVAELKNQHWIYGIESQLEWMNKNIKEEDYHLLGRDNNGVLKAYLTINKIQIRYDNKIENALGLGGVCVDKSIEHGGFGKQLVNVANDYIQKEQKTGLLLCKDRLVSFYKKCNWLNVDYDAAIVGGEKFENVIMVYPRKLKCKIISIDRTF